ncbi:unnamed protein product [Effrenium voratum]|nr:unnamed protein product [Effrenium voratum]
MDRPRSIASRLNAMRSANCMIRPAVYGLSASRLCQRSLAGFEVNCKVRPTEKASIHGLQALVSDRAVEDAVAGSSLAVAVVVPEKNDAGDWSVSTFASPDFEELFGYSVHELRGKSLLRLLSSGNVDPRVELYWNLASLGHLLQPTKALLQRKTGELVEAELLIRKVALPGSLEVLIFLCAEDADLLEQEVETLSSASGWVHTVREVNSHF